MCERFILYSDTFLWIKRENGLLYNCKSGKQYFFILTPDIKSICNHFLNVNNLYCYPFNYTSTPVPVLNFFTEIEHLGLGRYLKPSERIVVIPPLLKIEQSVERMKAQNRVESIQVSDYLKSITIYIGGQGEKNNLYQQTLYPFDSESRLSNAQIISFVHQAIMLSNVEINIVITDLHDLKLPSLLKELAGYSERIKIILSYSNDRISMLKQLIEERYSVVLLCRWDSHFEKATSLRRTEAIHWHFLVRDEEGMSAALSFCENMNSDMYEIIPIADNNLGFFRSNVFLNSDELKTIHVSKSQIYIHQTLNVNSFGKIVIMPDGAVFSNVLQPSIGTINDSLYELILKELLENHSWRVVRHSRHCDNCIYQWLCPSPTNYEVLLGHNRVCNFSDKDLLSFQAGTYS